MTEKKVFKIPPRKTPDRDSRYMGLAWMHAAFSKDPSTQVGAVIVSGDNFPLGSGYNGPPRLIDDNSFSWATPLREDRDKFSKYDVMVHAEINAIDHCCGADLTAATLYCTAMPCGNCMLEIVRKQFKKVVYMDFKSHGNSMLSSTGYYERSMEIAKLAGVKVEKFTGNINWVGDWSLKLQSLGLYEVS